ncbi:EAL domain-containing protein [Actimicrobium antarcticum]|uniref:Sensor domain-containing diguanylate cyclase n=1 Tax=Actimicrobium antarcticum TaxID=1051899 RepID=A0ABP7SGT7_9BURK
MWRKLPRLIGSLTVGRKLALIYFLDLVTVIFISGILIHEKYIAIDFARKEIIGNNYISTVREALLGVVEQGMLAPLQPAVGARQEANLVPAAQAINTAEVRFGLQMGSDVLSRQFSDALAASGQITVGQARTVTLGRDLLTRIGNQSNLILDPDLDSYYTMSLVVLRFPELLEVIAKMQQLATVMARSPEPLRAIEQTQFLILEGRIDAIEAGIDSDYREAYTASSPQLQTALLQSQQTLAQALTRFRSNSKYLAGMAEANSAHTANTEVNANAAAPVLVISALRNAWSLTHQQLQRLLQERIDEAFQRMWLHLGTALLLMTIILTLVFFVARQIALPISQLAGVADRVRRSGDYALRADWHSNDEIGRLVVAFNGMLLQLNQQRLEQQDLIAQASAALAQRALIEAIPIPLMVTSIPDHRILHANEAARDWLDGRERDPWQSGMTSESRARFFQLLSDTGAVDEFEVSWTAGVVPSWALVSARCLDYQGQPAVLTTFTPMNRIKQMESGLALWAKVFEASSESIVVMDQHGFVVTVNRAFQRGSAFEMHELIGKLADGFLSDRNPPDLFETVRHTTSSKGSWQGEVWLNRKNGGAYPSWLVMNAVRDSSAVITHFIAMSLDISERKASEQRIHYLAHHDALTGLPNRFSCDERLTLSIQQARRQHGKVAVLFVDLDRFKNINDSLGHHVGDQLLCSVAGRLSAAIRDGDTVSRLGGDEFIIILNNVDTVEEIGKIVEHRLIPAVRLPHLVDAVELYISCSIGVAVYPDDSDDIDGLKRHADSAMYQAKKLGRNNAQFFTPALNERVTLRLHLESDLRHATERNELVLHFQPRIDARSGRIAGVESLVRWQHPTEGMIPPVQFIPLAEESGLIIEIGAWIIDAACAQHQHWRKQGVGPMPISINLSALQLRDANLPTILSQAIARHAVPAAQIELELTESLLMDNVDDILLVLNSLKALGFSLSIDDFGTGYSSLNYLYRFPIDKLKIDRSFIQNIHTSADNLAVTRAIIGLGHTLGLEVVAEGVELASDVQVLQDAGCDELQGYHFSRPLPAAQFAEWLVAHRETVG